MIRYQKQKQKHIVNKPQISYVKQSSQNAKQRFEIIKRKVKHQILIKL